MIGERLDHPLQLVDHPLQLDREAEWRSVEAGAPGRWSDGRSKLHRRLLLLLATLAGLALLCLAYTRVSYTFDVNSDNPSIVLEAESFLQGNYLLRDWFLSSVPFLAELPFYALGILLLGGVRASLMYVVPVFFTVLAVALAVWLAGRGSARRAPLLGRLVTFLLIGLPSAALASNCLRGPGHLFTVVLLLAALLAIDRPARSVASPVRLLLVTLLLGLSIYSDRLALYVLVLPLALVCLMRLLRQGWRQSLTESWLLVACLAAWALAKGASALIAHAGGYYLPGIEHPWVDLPHLWDNVTLLIEGILRLSGATFIGRPMGSGTLLALLHLPGLAFVLFSLGRVMISWRARTRAADLVSEILAAGMLASLATFLATQVPYRTRDMAQFFDVAHYRLGVGFDTSRYLLPFIFFGAILAGRVGIQYLLQRAQGQSDDRVPEFVAISARNRIGKRSVKTDATGAPRRDLKRHLGVVLAALGLVHLSAFAQLLCAPIQTPSRLELCEWLRAHGLRCGYSTFWNSQIVTLLSEGEVKVLNVWAPEGKIWPHGWLNQKKWYPGMPGYQGAPANFVVLDNRNYDDVEPEEVLRTFGRPSEEHQVGEFRVLIWDKGLPPLLPSRANG